MLHAEDVDGLVGAAKDAHVDLMAEFVGQGEEGVLVLRRGNGCKGLR